MIRIIEIVGMANVIVGAALSYLFLGPLMWNQAAGYGFIFSAVITSGIMFFIILRHQKERSETAVIEKDMTKKLNPMSLKRNAELKRVRTLKDLLRQAISHMPKKLRV